jgi:ferredoxin
MASHQKESLSKRAKEKGDNGMRVIASTEKCIASGSCVLACPQVFGQRDEDGVVRILQMHPSLDLRERIRQAVEQCPALVFCLEEEQQTAELTVVEETSD